MSDSSPNSTPVPTPDQSTDDRWAVLRNPDFRLLLMLRVASWMALQSQAVIVGWQIYQLKHDPLLLGLIGLAEAVPAICGSFISGHLVDTHRPIRILRLSVTALLFNSCLLWFAVSPLAALETDARILILFAGVFISGAARCFTGPAVFTVVPQIVSRKQFAASSAWSSSSFQMATIVGPAFIGLVYGEFGALAAFGFPVAFQIFAFSCSLALSKKTAALRSDRAHEPFLKSVGAGLRFTFGHRVLLSAMTLDMFSVLFGGAVAVLPIYADRILHVGASGLGMLRAAPAIGSIVISLTLAVRPMRVISGRTLLLVVAAFGLATLGFAVSTNFYIAIAFLALTGIVDGVSMVIRQTILQLLTPQEMRGRVSSVSSVFITSSNEIGAFESGVAARMMGLVPSVIFGGVMTLVVVATTAWFAPELGRTRLDTTQD